MSRIAFSSRIVLCFLAILTLSACGPTIGNTFSSISNSLPGDEPTEAPAATEPPAEEPAAVEATVNAPVGSLASPTPPSSTTISNFPPPAPFQPTVQPAIPERRRLTLEFPPQIRAGDSDVVRLTLEVDDLGNVTPTAEVAGNVVTGEVIVIPNLYETHNVIAEARFDIAGVQVSPPGLSSQSLAQGQSVSFFWSILPDGVGVYRGTVWLYLRFVERVSGEESQNAISAQPVEIEAVNFLGLSAGLARSVGVVGSIAGTILGFPFLEDIVKLLFRRRKIK